MRAICLPCIHCLSCFSRKQHNSMTAWQVITSLVAMLGIVSLYLLHRSRLVMNHCLPVLQHLSIMAGSAPVDENRKYSGQDPQRLTCKKVPSPSSIREMSTLKLFKWLLPESPLHRLTLYCMRVNYRSRG